MHPLLLIPLLACFAATFLAAAVIARDPGHRVHQLTGAILCVSAWWSLLEFVWNQLDDSGTVVQLVRISGIGWLWLGPLVFHFFLELLDDPDDRLSGLRWLLPWLYGATAVSVLLYVATPWGIDHATRTSWGWSFEFGPLFPLIYLQTALPPGLVVLNWRRAYPTRGSRVERREWAFGWVVIGGILCVASLTDAILPLAGVHVPRLGSASVSLIGVLVAVSLTRRGHSLLAPGAFAGEILDALAEGVALAHPDGRIRVTNRALREMAGEGWATLLDADLASLLPDLESISAPAPAPDRRWRERTTWLVRSDGERIPVAVASSPLRDRKGILQGRVVAVRDLREVVKLRERLVTAGRLAAVGELSAGIAREIQHPIARVRSYLSELRSEWEALADEAARSDGGAGLDAVFAEGEELIDESLEGADRVASITRDVGGFTGLASEGAAVDLNDVVEAAIRVAQPRVVDLGAAGIDVQAAPVPLVWGAAHELEQVFVNLLHNGLQAVAAGGGRVRVRTGLRDDRVWVRVEDDGPGIPPEARGRIFDPFFTTKPVGEGTGLGLAISYQIVRAHGGEIQVESEPGRGAAFEVSLPASHASTRAVRLEKLGPVQGRRNGASRPVRRGTA